MTLCYGGLNVDFRERFLPNSSDAYFMFYKASLPPRRMPTNSYTGRDTRRMIVGAYWAIACM